MTTLNVARKRKRFSLALIAIAMALGLSGKPAHGAFIAYVNPAGNGNSFAGGPTGLASMGMDFDVNSAITVTSLGAFDFAQDGQFLHDVVVGIFDRDTQSLVGSTVTFSTASPGTLIDGSRFISLSTPLQLSSEFHGSIVAFGYSSTGGGGGEPFVDESNNVANWTLNDGGGLLSFVGTSRYSVTSSLAFPALIYL